MHYRLPVNLWAILVNRISQWYIGYLDVFVKLLTMDSSTLLPSLGIFMLMSKPIGLDTSVLDNQLLVVYVSWLAVSSIEAKYRFMSFASSEVIWLRRLLCEIGALVIGLTPLNADNTNVIQIANNPPSTLK